jgi:hypothetical protein
VHNQYAPRAGAWGRGDLIGLTDTGEATLDQHVSENDVIKGVSTGISTADFANCAR